MSDHRGPRDVAVVTGAGSERGIGLRTCRRLASDGFAVALCDRDAEGLAEAKAELIRDFDVPVIGQVLDIGDESAVNRFRDDVEAALGPARILVNNAGINRTSPFENITLAEWEEVFRINSTGAFLVTRAFLPAMRRLRWGRVIFISSMAAVRGGGFFLGSSHYAASKASLLGMTRALAREMGVDGVTVNAITPGYVDTGMTAVDGEARRIRAMIEMTPVGRIGQPEDIASLISYLATEGAGYITGTTIDVNGGSHIR